MVARGDVAGALQALEELVKNKPSDPDAQSQYAQALNTAGRRDEAIAHFELAASLSSAPVHKLNLAVALNQAGRTQPAIDQYQQVLLADPKNDQALREIGNLLNRAGKFDQAATYLNQALEASPNDLSVQQDLAWALESSGN
jgi:tetratricopeptide (TPR) repeat protein